MQKMGGLKLTRKPSFVWQALLILLPVIVLAAVGIFSLRQDKQLAQHEAADRAQAVADDLVPKLWAALAESDNRHRLETHAFRINARGELVHPPPVALFPQPKPLKVADLTPDQWQIWQTAQIQEQGGKQLAIGSYRKFLATNPPENFAAAAEYALGLLLIKTGDKESAVRCFEAVNEKYPDAVGDSGLPLQPLAQFKLVELDQ